jgi:antitoxin PrlF
MPDIHEVATLTSKGQITLPKPIRQALGVDAGSKVAFDLGEDGRVTVSRAGTGHEDPAIQAFLTLLARDIQSGRHVRGLPDDLARAMLEQLEPTISLDEEIDGDVVI